MPYIGSYFYACFSSVPLLILFHLKKRREIVIHITVITNITMTEIITLFAASPSEAALSNLMPCVNGRMSAAFRSAAGITS